MSIKTVVFDFGQVMVHFEPSYMVGKYVTDKEDAALLEKVVFDRLYWDKLDAGTIIDRSAASASFLQNSLFVQYNTLANSSSCL